MNTLSYKIDIFIKEHQLTPPEPGLIFSNTKHRWVRPETLGYGTAGEDLTTKIKDARSEVSFIHQNAYRFKGFAPTQKVNFAEKLINLYSALGKVGKQMSQEVSENKKNLGVNFITDDDPMNPINRARGHIKEALKKIKEDSSFGVESELSKFSGDFDQAIWRYENGSSKKVIEKALHVSSREEAQKYGIKLPPDESKKTPKKQDRLPSPEPKDVVKPKKKETRKPDIVGEIGRQITPLGPGYHSPEDIVHDVKESQRVSSNIKNFLARKKNNDGE